MRIPVARRREKTRPGGLVGIRPRRQETSTCLTQKSAMNRVAAANVMQGSASADGAYRTGQDPPSSASMRPKCSPAAHYRQFLPAASVFVHPPTSAVFLARICPKAVQGSERTCPGGGNIRRSGGAFSQAIAAQSVSRPSCAVAAMGVRLNLTHPALACALSRERHTLHLQEDAWASSAIWPWPWWPRPHSRPAPTSRHPPPHAHRRRHLPHSST